MSFNEPVDFKNKKHFSILAFSFFIAFLIFLLLALSLWLQDFAGKSLLTNLIAASKQPDLEKELDSSETYLIQVQTVKQLNTELLASEGKGKSMVDAAKERKTAMLELMEHAPFEIFNLLLSAADRNSLHFKSRELVEKRVTYQGRIEVHITDDFIGRQSKTEYVFLEGGKTHRLRFASTEPDQLLSGAAVKVSGIELDDIIVVYSADEAGGFEALALAEPEVLGAQKTLLLLINFEENTMTNGITVESARQAVFSGADSVNAFIQEASYGKASLVGDMNPSGDVFGFYTLPGRGTCGGTSGQLEAAAPDVNLLNYERIILLVISDVSCAPYSTVGKAILNTPDGEILASVSYSFNLNLGIIAHELSHGFGLHHANAWDCPVLGSNVECTINYGDPFDVMGGAVGRGYGHHNAPHKERLSWFSPSNLIDIDLDMQSGVVQLEIKPLAISTAEPQYIRLRRGQGQPAYYIEYRRPIGFDDVPGNPSTDGALIHWMHEDIIELGIGDTQLIDTTPGSAGGSADFNDSVLTIGSTFEEQVLGFLVTSKTMDANRLVVDIEAIEPVIDLAPRNLTAVAFSPTEVHVFWRSVEEAARYDVYRSNGTIGEAPMEFLGSTSVPFYRDVVTQDSFLTYYVQSVDAADVASLLSFPQIVHPFFGRDDDGDGFSDSLELYLGTSPAGEIYSMIGCPRTSGDDVWPPDLTANRKVTSIDRSLLGDQLGRKIGDNNFNLRYDLYSDGRIDGFDVNQLDRFFGQSCGSPFTEPAGANIPPLKLYNPDMNGDGAITVGDIVIVINAFGGRDPDRDLNGDGAVTVGDLLILSQTFGTAYWPPLNSATQPLSINPGEIFLLYVTAPEDNRDRLPILRYDCMPVSCKTESQFNLFENIIEDTRVQRGQFFWTPAESASGWVVFWAEYAEANTEPQIMYINIE